MKFEVFNDVVASAVTARDAPWNAEPRPATKPLPSIHEFFFGTAREFQNLCEAVALKVQQHGLGKFGRDAAERVVAVVVALFAVYAQKAAAVAPSATYNRVFLQASWADVTRITDDLRAIIPQFAKQSVDYVRTATLLRLVGWKFDGEKPIRAEVAEAYEVFRRQVQVEVFKCLDVLLNGNPHVIGYPDVLPENVRMLADELCNRLLYGVCECATGKAAPTSPPADVGKGKSNAERKWDTCRDHHRLDAFDPAQQSLEEFIRRAVQGTSGEFYPKSYESGMLNWVCREIQHKDTDFQPCKTHYVLLRACGFCGNKTTSMTTDKCLFCGQCNTFCEHFEVARYLVREDLQGWTEKLFWRCDCDKLEAPTPAKWFYPAVHCGQSGADHAHDKSAAVHDRCPRCGAPHGQRPMHVLVLQ